MNFEELLLRLLWIAGGIPLIIYPGVLLAGVMSFAAPKVKGKNMSFGFRLFLIVTLFFPLIYFISYKSSCHFYETHNFNLAVITALSPIAISIVLYWQIKKK